MKRTVRILRRAQDDLQRIYRHVAVEAPSRAGSFMNALLDAIESLERFADRGGAPRDPVLRGRRYRFLVHRRYVVFYKVTRREVLVHRVLHVRRAYKDLL